MSDREGRVAFFEEVKREDDATRAAMNRWWAAFDKSLGAAVALTEGRATLALTKETVVPDTAAPVEQPTTGDGEAACKGCGEPFHKTATASHGRSTEHPEFGNSCAPF